MNSTETAANRPTMVVDDDGLRAALDVANLPTLMLVLATFTGDRSWLKGGFTPTRTRALNDNDDAGLPQEQQGKLRAAAFEIIRDWRDGRRAAPAPPSDDQIVPLLSAALGEQIPEEYAVTFAEEAGFHPREVVRWSDERPAAADDFHVVIIGAGPAGVAAAITLDRLGIPYTEVERNEAVGGVWLINDYPGAGVDTPSALYSFSFAPSRGWSRYYVRQPEILAYIQQTARDFGVEDKVRFKTEVTGATWDEASQKWQVQIRAQDGTLATLEANAVMSCVGLLTTPAIPAFEGMDSFGGPMFHSARWDHDVDVTGKNVAVIGTGATSMQIVPAIVDDAASVTVFQRSPQWVAPNENYLREIDADRRVLFEQVPFYASYYRLRQIWMFQDKLLATLFRDPEWPHPERSVNAINDKHRIFLTNYVDSVLGDRTDLRPKVLPDYPPYGKRILMDNNWIATVKRDDVTLVADGVRGFEPGAVVSSSGERHPADIVVLATGFHASRMLWPMDIRGRETTLREQWGEEDASAYLGISVPGFPNMFIVGGPNTALGHGGSAIYINECATAYIAQMLVRMIEGRIGTVEVRREVAAAYEEKVDALHERLIWTHPGMTNWYRNTAGRVTATIPFRGVEYWQMTRTPDLSDYEQKPARQSASAEPFDGRTSAKAM